MENFEDECRELTDAELENVVGGLAVVGGVSIGLSVFRIFQGVRIRRELAQRK